MKTAMKKAIPALLAVTMAVTAAAVPVSAEDLDVPVTEEIIEEYAIFDVLQSSLSVSGYTATCVSYGASVEASTITVTQTLEKYSGWLWFWDPVATWNKTEYGDSVSAYNRRGGLSSGTYRLCSVFTVTSTTGQTETVTVYSSEQVL